MTETSLEETLRVLRQERRNVALPGLVAVFLGSQALHRIDRYADQLMGEGMAILTITLGWLAVIISAVASFASLGWPILSR